MTARKPRVRTVCVFCGSSRRCHERYLAGAAEMGRVLARGGYTLLYGGGRVGSMGRLADAALAAGGEVVGVIPRFMVRLEWQHPGLSDLIVVEDLHERKDRMLGADAVVALPGGTGTLEEITEALTRKRLGLYLGPIVFVNTADFFDPFLRQLEACVEQAFLDPRHRGMWETVREPSDVPKAFRSAAEWSARAREFAAL
jgi:uncharacterized protein (TIGR00730 family)